ncbi:MAG: hypothetical protein RL701_7221 [Pseudomonadota bacterium]|jgi:hypothetical protein
MTVLPRLTRFAPLLLSSLVGIGAAAPMPLLPTAYADDQTPAGERKQQKSAAMTGEVWVLLASGEEGTIDPSLSHLRALKQPPFNEYKSMKVLSRSTMPLPLDQPVEVELPKRRTLILRLVSRQADGRAKVQLSINRPNQKDALPLLHVIASEKEPFFVAGQKFEGGTLVIGVRVTEQTKAKL